MAWVYISLGSNIDREANTRAGSVALQAQYGDLILSSVYESEAVGFEGSSFFNMVIALKLKSRSSGGPALAPDRRGLRTGSKWAEIFIQNPGSGSYCYTMTGNG